MTRNVTPITMYAMLRCKAGSMLEASPGCSSSFCIELTAQSCSSQAKGRAKCRLALAGGSTHDGNGGAAATGSHVSGARCLHCGQRTPWPAPMLFIPDLACGTRRPLLRSRHPRIHFQSFSVDESFVFQTMNQDNITRCEPTCRGVHWPAFSVRFDARSVREDDGVFPLVVDLNPFDGQPIRFIEVIAAGLIGPEDSPSGSRFGAARSQEMSTTLLSRRLGGRTKAKQDRRAPAWCDETRAVAGSRDKKVPGQPSTASSARPSTRRGWSVVNGGRHAMASHVATFAGQASAAVAPMRPWSPQARSGSGTSSSSTLERTALK